MPEPIVQYYRVRLTRHGEDAGTFFVLATDVDDAVTKAKEAAALGKEEAQIDNPFDDLNGLEAWVQPR